VGSSVRTFSLVAVHTSTSQQVLLCWRSVLSAGNVRQWRLDRVHRRQVVMQKVFNENHCFVENTWKNADQTL